MVTARYHGQEKTKMPNQIPWTMAAAVFLGTLPLLGAMVWNLVEVKEIRKEISLIRTELANIRERLATLEERDRLSHAILTK